ncbi:MAG: hypothetical protein LBQ42_12615 [Synergistaceae bacterium]|jgi:hypothetical protein|nr:hypothetical protein [Synergistaceae bacterium]
MMNKVMMEKFLRRGISTRRVLRLLVSLGIVACCIRTEPARATPVIAAYQEIYAMNFEVYWTEGLPSGWYATFDGYPVAQIAPNRWVYGRVRRQGSIVPTNVLVGAVVPMDVPELARVAASSWRSGAYETKAFRSIALSGLDNMGVLDDPLAYTPVAWKTGVAGLRIWLGNRWYSIAPAAGQSTSQALLARHPYIVRTLRKKNALLPSWTRSDTQDLADLAREWGYIWRGAIPFASLTARRDDNSGNGIAGPSAAVGGASPGAPGGGQWDVGGGGGTLGGGGGGWDAGGGSLGGGNGGGGWDSGGGHGGASPEDDDGGWDK